MKELNNAKSVLGMDDPYNSMFYRDVPEEYRISNFLTVPTKRVLTNQFLPTLLESLEMYYSDFEIVGQTLEDFKRLVQIAYNLNGETFERMLSVYEDDIAYPILGRTEKTRYFCNTHGIAFYFGNTIGKRSSYVAYRFFFYVAFC